VDDRHEGLGARRIDQVLDGGDDLPLVPRRARRQLLPAGLGRLMSGSASPLSRTNRTASSISRMPNAAAEKRAVCIEPTVATCPHSAAPRALEPKIAIW